MGKIKKKLIIGNVIIISIIVFIGVIIGFKFIDATYRTSYEQDLSTSKDLTVEGTIKGASPVRMEEALEFIDADGITTDFLIFHDNPLEVTHFDDDLTDSLIFQTVNIGNANNMEVVFYDEDSGKIAFAINEGASGRASTFNRSLQIGKSLGEYTTSTFTLCTGNVHADCDTPLTGADLFIEDDIEAKGNVMAQGGLFASGSLYVDGGATVGVFVATGISTAGTMTANLVSANTVSATTSSVSYGEADRISVTTIEGTTIGGVLLGNKVTSDPCGGSYIEGAIFYNDTSDYLCFCNGSGDDVQAHSPGTACF